MVEEGVWADRMPPKQAEGNAGMAMVGKLEGGAMGRAAGRGAGWPGD